MICYRHEGAWILGRDAVDGYVWMQGPTLNLGTSMPVRVETGTPDPAFRHRPVGFTARFDEVEPQLWEGDNA